MNKNLAEESEMTTEQDSNVGKKAISGFKWLAVGKFIGQFISWAITLYVIRLLAPTDYGLMAMATAFTAILALLNEMGLGAAIIQAEHIEQRGLQQIFGVIIIINVSLFFVLFATAPLIAFFFKESQVILVIRVLGVQFIFMSFNTIPQSLLERNLRFKQRSIVDFFANLIGGFTTLSLALSGKGVWSLVFGTLILFLSRTIGLNIFSPFLYRPIFSFKGMRRFVSFGGVIMFERILWYFYSQLDSFVIGRILGTELLGFYSVGKHVSSLPLQKVSPIINQVVFPAFSRIQNQLREIRFYTLKGVRLISIFSFPVFWGISSIAPELVAIVLGNKWLLATTPLVWISIVLPLGMISGIIASTLKGLGRPGRSLQNMFIACIIMPTAFLIGCKWGIEGVSLAWIVGFPIYFLIVLIRFAPQIKLRVFDILREMIKPCLSSAIMYLSVAIAKNFLKGLFHPFFELGIFILIGAAIYIALQISFNREGLLEVLRLVRK